MTEPAAHTEVPATPPKPPEGPFSSDQAVPTLIMFFVAALGGLVSFYQKWKSGQVRVFNFTELIGELVVSGFCGIVAFWLCSGLATMFQWWNPYLTAAVVGIVGHMGTRSLFIAEGWMTRKFAPPVPSPVGDPTPAQDQEVKQ